MPGPEKRNWTAPAGTPLSEKRPAASIVADVVVPTTSTVWTGVARVDASAGAATTAAEPDESAPLIVAPDAPLADDGAGVALAGVDPLGALGLPEPQATAIKREATAGTNRNVDMIASPGLDGASTAARCDSRAAAHPLVSRAKIHNFAQFGRRPGCEAGRRLCKSGYGFLTARSVSARSSRARTPRPPRSSSSAPCTGTLTACRGQRDTNALGTKLP